MFRSYILLFSLVEEEDKINGSLLKSDPDCFFLILALLEFHITMKGGTKAFENSKTLSHNCRHVKCSFQF